jgi:hypothetical protein
MRKAFGSRRLGRGGLSETSWLDRPGQKAEVQWRQWGQLKFVWAGVHGFRIVHASGVRQGLEEQRAAYVQTEAEECSLQRGTSGGAEGWVQSGMEELWRRGRRH